MHKAIKNGVTRIFGDDQWRNMPKDKFGWVEVAEGAETPNIVSSDIIQKKMVAGEVADAVKPVPEEIVKSKPADIPEIKRKPGRQPK